MVCVVFCLLFWYCSSKYLLCFPLHLEERKIQTTEFQISNSIVIPTNLSSKLGNHWDLLKIISLLSLQVLLHCKILSTVQIIFGQSWHGVDANNTRSFSGTLYIYFKIIFGSTRTVMFFWQVCQKKIYSSFQINFIYHLFSLTSLLKTYGIWTTLKKRTFL